MKRSLLISTLVAAALGGAAPAHAAVPTIVPFAGRLVHDGTAVSGSETIVFRLYDAQVGGNLIWDETHDNTGVEDGLVYARLGSLEPLDASLFDGSLFLEVEVIGGDGPFVPRLPIESVPYALHAATADTLGGFQPDDLQARVADGCAAGSSIRGIGADGAVTCEPDDDTATVYTGGGPIAVTGTAITLSANGCQLGDVWKWSGSAWSCDGDDDAGGTITGVTAGAGLSGGGATGAVSLAVNPAAVQTRIAAGCAAGMSIRAIAQDGTVTCEADDNAGGTITGVTASTGLSGGGATGTVSLSVNPAAVQTRIGGTCAAGTSIRAIAQDGTVTCEADDDTNSGGTITGVTAGTGLSGGGATGAVSLSVNPAAVQTRIGGTCAAGSSIRAIAQDGTVTCEADDNGGGTITGVTAGTGLTGGGTTGGISLAVNPAAVQSRIGGTCVAGSAIRAIAQDGTVTCEPKAPRTFLGTAPLTFTTYAGTPSGWTQVSYESFDLQVALANAADFVKPGQPIQGRLCMLYTDNYAAATNLHLRIRHRDNAGIVYYSADMPGTWSNSQLSIQRCGPWVDSSVLQACTANFAQGTCSLDLKHDNNAYTVIYNLQLQLAAVN